MEAFFQFAEDFDVLRRTVCCSFVGDFAPDKLLSFHVAVPGLDLCASHHAVHRGSSARRGRLSSLRRR